MEMLIRIQTKSGALLEINKDPGEPGCVVLKYLGLDNGTMIVDLAELKEALNILERFCLAASAVELKEALNTLGQFCLARAEEKGP